MTEAEVKMNLQEGSWEDENDGKCSNVGGERGGKEKGNVPYVWEQFPPSHRAFPLEDTWAKDKESLWTPVRWSSVHINKKGLTGSTWGVLTGAEKPAQGREFQEELHETLSGIGYPGLRNGLKLEKSELYLEVSYMKPTGWWKLGQQRPYF